MPLYFAYGSNMDRDMMARRCPRSKAVGPARLARHRLAVMREGWLTVVAAPGGAVHGLLWDLALADVPALDRYERVASSLYVKRFEPVLAAHGARRALVYRGAVAGTAVANPSYLAEVIAAARAAGLPPGGLAALEALCERPARRSAAGGP